MVVSTFKAEPLVVVLRDVSNGFCHFLPGPVCMFVFMLLNIPQTNMQVFNASAFSGVETI